MQIAIIKAEAANLVKINICVIRNTFGQGCSSWRKAPYTVAGDMLSDTAGHASGSKKISTSSIGKVSTSSVIGCCRLYHRVALQVMNGQVIIFCTVLKSMTLVIAVYSKHFFCSIILAVLKMWTM